VSDVAVERNEVDILRFEFLWKFLVRNVDELCAHLVKKFLEVVVHGPVAELLQGSSQHHAHNLFHLQRSLAALLVHLTQVVDHVELDFVSAHFLLYLHVEVARGRQGVYHHIRELTVVKERTGVFVGDSLLSESLTGDYDDRFLFPFQNAVDQEFGLVCFVQLFLPFDYLVDLGEIEFWAAD